MPVVLGTDRYRVNGGIAKDALEIRLVPRSVTPSGGSPSVRIVVPHGRKMSPRIGGDRRRPVLLVGVGETQKRYPDGRIQLHRRRSLS